MFTALPLAVEPGREWLDDWGNYGSLIAAIAAVLAIVFAVWRWWFRRRLWDNPLIVTYHIPQQKYSAIVFPGAPTAPENPEHITLGIGQYLLIHRVGARTHTVIKGVQIEFHGEPESGRPRNYGQTAPMLVRKFESELGEALYEDWYGMTRQVRDVTRFPKHLARGDWWIVGHRIETREPWAGVGEVIIMCRSEDGGHAQTVRTRLPLHVSREHDRIPFLRW